VRELGDVNGHEFLRKLRKLAKEKKLQVVHEEAHGKGSHGRIYFGTSYTTLKDPKKEIGPGLLSKMCRDLGIKPNEL
jgi:mRNA interferase HicA